MLRAAVDINTKVSGLFSQRTKRFSASRELLNAYARREFILVESFETIAEFREVVFSEAMRKKPVDHGLIERFCEFVETNCELYDPPRKYPASMTRDPTDVKWLDLAADSNADYLVTRDARHILHLKQIGRTKIVTPHKFMRALREHASTPPQ